MATIKLALHDQSIPDKIQFARQVAAKATGNPDPIDLDPDSGDFTGDHEDTIAPTWDQLRGVRSYPIDQTTDGQTWRLAGASTKSSHIVAGFSSGVKMRFRASAIGAAGQGPWNDQASKVAP